ncbi:MAG: hypothetical protein DWI22_12220 [Planctomycetota bacterium]|nr:MAG: hypothetical protein DWI22_12220 [Planctomycetota bacterium]
MRGIFDRLGRAIEFCKSTWSKYKSLTRPSMLGATIGIASFQRAISGLATVAKTFRHTVAETRPELTRNKIDRAAFFQRKMANGVALHGSSA